MRRILITGRDGQVGWELQRCLSPLGEVTAVGRADFDLADESQLRACVRALQPDWIVNAAAYTAVDRAESDVELATSINARAPEILAQEAARLGSALIHYSTDYVYGGDKVGPYLETDPTAPLSVYGQTKLAGERSVASACERYWIFRTAWVYAARGKNFLRTMLRLAGERPSLRVVADQFGSPTWSRMIAEATAAAIAGGPIRANNAGIYHMTSGGQTSWHGFASRIVELGAEAGLCPEVSVDAITGHDYPTPARRPANSVLCNDKLKAELGISLPDWDCSLKLCLAELSHAQ